jgi:hypothetical protein
MSAMLAADYRDATIKALEDLRATFERQRATALRFATHAASVNNSDVADHFAKEARVWSDAIDEIALKLQVEQGR